MSRRVVFLIIALVSCLSAAGHNIRHYDVTSGLSENTVKGITQDIYGYIWLGTQDGLNQFNGREFRSFGCSSHSRAERDEGSLNILSVLLHPDGKHIWLVCRSTVTLFDPVARTYKDISFPEKTEPTCVAYDQDGNLWIGTADGIYIYSESQDTVRRLDLCKSGNQVKPVNAILKDSRGIIWICGENGFFRYLPFTRKFERISDRDALSVMEDSAGDIWVGLWYDGFARYNPETNGIDVFPRIAEDGTAVEILRVRSMLEEKTGSILLCTNRGLFRYSKSTGKFRKIILTSQRTTDNVYSCFKDREGGIWIGTYFNGLYYLLPKDGTIEAYTPENTPEHFHGSAVSSFCEDSEGRIWIGAENGGLSLFVPSENTFRPLPFSNPADNLHALYMDSGKLYIGTFARGLMQADIARGTFKTYTSGRSGAIPDNHVFSLFKLEDGRLIVGTRRGCAVFDPRQERFTEIPQLADAFIYAICQDSEGYLWFADYYNGLHRLDGIGGTYKHYEHLKEDPSSLPSDRLVGVQTDDIGELWVSSDGGGLCRYDRESDSFIPFTIRDAVGPRRISVIYGFVNDKMGRLWISSNDGIWCCDKNGNGKHYSGADGLQSSQFNYGAIFRSTTGKLYFGGINGFNVIDPDAIPASTPQPLMTASVSWNLENGKTVILQRITERGRVSVPRNISHFNLSLECLSYLSPENTRFRYTIDNGHEIYTGSDGFVTFADFPYGKHVITACAIVGGTTQSANTVRILINNRPPLYLSSGAKVLYVVSVILLILIFIYRLGKRKVEKAEKQAYQAKLDFFTQIAHEIKTPVALIKGPLDVILHEPHPDHEQHHLDIIRKNTERLQVLTGQLLDFKKISTDGYALNLKGMNPAQTIVQVMDSFDGYRDKTLDFSFEPDPEIGFCQMDAEAFTKIVSNLIGNAVKHTKSLIRIELSLKKGNEPDMVHLSVKDNGKGIPPEEATHVFDSFYQIRNGNESRAPGIGLGLALVKLLAEKHNGRAYVDTAFKEGCCMCVDIPYIPARAKAPSSETARGAAGTGIRMLVVEDNTEMLDFLRSTLQSEYIVLEAVNGTEALEILGDNDVDIVISDIYMPGGDGFSLLQRVRSDEMLCHIPFILLTAESSLESKIKGLEYGANAYLEKPFSIEHLLATVKSILKDREIMRKSFRSTGNLPSERSRDTEFLERISGIILERMGEDWISVEELAEKLNVSHSSLQRKLKGLTGLSPVEFIRTVKLKKAAELLASGKYRVNEVCYAIGFNKPAYFSSCFKKQFGVLPKDYVKGKQHD